jgi:hypothetical protein
MNVFSVTTITIECTRDEALLIRNAIKYRRTEKDDGVHFWDKEADNDLNRIQHSLSAALDRG